jgi:hypothetical protein
MAQKIRRNSMEHLQLYDLDKLTILTSNHQLPPPLPPPRKCQSHLPSDIAFERYQFLCDMTRHKTDPIYAKTPMFRTIPQSKPVEYHRRVLGTRFPPHIITPILTTSPNSEEPESAETDNEEEEEQENADEDDKQDSDNDDGDDDDNDDDDDDDDDDDSDGDKSRSSSSSKGSSKSDSGSSSSSSGDDDDMFNDDDDKRGIVEKLFDRNKK